MELQVSEYQKLVKDSQPFRGQYAYKLSEIIDTLEKTMKYNLEQLQNSILDYSSNGIKHQNETCLTIEQLQKELKDIALPESFEKHLQCLPEFNVNLI